MSKPPILDRIRTTNVAVKHGNVVAYDGTTGKKICDSGVNMADLKLAVDRNPAVYAHINNANIHVTAQEKKDWTALFATMNTHLVNNSAHVSTTDRQTWNAKETPDGAQAKANIVQSNLNKHINNLEVHVTKQNKLAWDNKYTKEEIDNKFSTYEFGNDWKEAVDTFDDLDKVYPSPYAGWTVNVLDTNITYRFDGVDWVAVSANAIPDATESIRGLMTAKDKKKLNGIEENANAYEHPDGPDTQHVTQQEKDYWSSKADKNLASYTVNGLLSKEDKYKLDGIEEGATNFVLPEYFDPTIIKEDVNHRFCTDEEKDYWSKKANNVLATPNLDGLLPKEDKRKLNSVEFNANYYVHPEFHYPAIIKEDADHRFVTDAEKIAWNKKAETSVVTPDANGIMTKEDKIKLDTIEEYANNYKHPEYHYPSMIKEDSEHRFVTDADILNWNGKLDSRRVIAGDGVFNSTTGTFIAHDIGHTTYSVSIIPTANPKGTVGDIWVEKENNNIVVKCTGPANNIAFDWLITEYTK